MYEEPIIRTQKYISKEEAKEMYPDSNNKSLLMKCNICNKTDLIHRKDGKTWKCPYCEFIDKNEEIFQKNITNHLKMYEKLADLNEKCEDNMKRLNNMMLELKSIIAMVRPMAKKNDWYGEEVVLKDESGKPDIKYSINYRQPKE